MQDMTGFVAYDDLAIEPLERLGWQVRFVPWDQSEIDWNQFDAVVIRSTWDYQHRVAEFIRVLKQIDASRARLFNPLPVCLWNMNKAYLRELGDKGCAVLPTVWFDRLAPEDLDGIWQRWNVERLVVKPAVGANADHAFVLAHGNREGTAEALETYQARPGLVQPFVDAIESEGEFSLFFFGGEYSHAIRKRPKPGDFRVQEEHGGIIESCSASEDLRQAAAAVLQHVEGPLLYARVDLVRYFDRWCVMEIELIEPSLYFPYADSAPRTFAAALDRVCR